MASAALLPPPPTRQLFVRFRGRHRPRSRRDVEELFSDFGRLKHAHLGQSGDVAFVTYWHLREAREAVARLDKREYRGYDLQVGHSRVTRLLAIGDVPSGLATPTTEAAVREVVAAHGVVDWTVWDDKKATVYVMMRTEADAARATKELQGAERGGWRWEIEFYKENAIRPPLRSQSLPGASSATAAPAPATPVHREAASTPAQVPPPSVRHEAAAVVAAAPPTPTPPRPAAAAANTPVGATTPAAAASEKQSTTTREHPPSPLRSRSRSHSPPPRLRSLSRSPSRSRSRSRSPPRKKGRRRSARQERSPSRSSSSSRSRSPSPPRKKGRRHVRQPSQERSPPPRSPEPTPVRLDRQRRSTSPEAQPPAAAIECSECLRLVTHLNEDHSIAEDEQTKQLVKAWFNGNFELATKRDPSRKPESIRRLRFLDEHVNPFLESAGLATWTTRTPLYAHWFQREVLRLSAAEVGHSRPLQLHRRTSVQVYAERLRHLLAAVEKQSA